MIVRISPAAEGELESIGDYIAQDNSRRAVSFVREFRDHVRASQTWRSPFRLCRATRIEA
ncbi:type II toxin-antitoxin system RelE/ParE family toxin [Paraburkholderia sp. MPAMCS5]|uniref:type II toxin-antitoxin system RelE/ParE family toxin n=1 Tax=Paraburkholderia sp. MPAMCS5 TaxID=3112563 RepID=UPI003FA79CDA